MSEQDKITANQKGHDQVCGRWTYYRPNKYELKG